MSFKNIKIGAKINATVLVNLVLTVFVAGVGIYFIYQLNQQLNSIVDVSAERIKVSARMNRLLVQIGRAEKNMILAESQEEMDRYATETDGYIVELNNYLTRLKALFAGDNAAQLDQFSQELKEYLAINTQVRELTRANNDQEATALSQGKAREVYDRAAAVLIKITDDTEAGLQADKESSDRSFWIAFYIQLAVGVVSLVVGLTLGIVISRGISRGLNDMVKVASSIADGNLNQTVVVNSNDEVGELARAFQRMIDDLNKTLRQINAVSDQVVLAVEQIGSVSQDLAANAEEQSSASEEVTSNLEETEAQVKANADNANLANQLVAETADTANVGQDKMKTMTGAMSAIAQSSQEIGKIIKVIDEIAFQTNLLALNAAVEAARAGQYGRGFAVVAQEVRNLAGRSAKAAKETAELIEGSGRRVQEGVGIAEEMAAALSDIVQKVAKVKDLVAEINVASEEQAKGVTQINIAMMQVSQGAQNNSQQSEELAGTADELGSLADRLREEMARFRLKQQQTFAYGAAEDMTAVKASAQTAPAGGPVPKVKQANKTTGSNGRSELVLDHDERGYGQF